MVMAALWSRVGMRLGDAKGQFTTWEFVLGGWRVLAGVALLFSLLPSLPYLFTDKVSGTTAVRIDKQSIVET